MNLLTIGQIALQLAGCVAVLYASWLGLCWLRRNSYAERVNRRFAQYKTEPKGHLSQWMRLQEKINTAAAEVFQQHDARLTALEGKDYWHRVAEAALIQHEDRMRALEAASPSRTTASHTTTSHSAAERETTPVPTPPSSPLGPPITVGTPAGHGSDYAAPPDVSTRRGKTPAQDAPAR